MFDYKTQLIEELGDLQEKVAELAEMTVQEGFVTLPALERSLVQQQLQAMTQYARALEARVDLT